MRAAYEAAWRAANPERVRAYARKHHLRSFGLTPDDYVALLEAQGGTCALCGRPERVKDRMGNTRTNLAVDHDAITGAVRGLLCHHCNAAIGHAEHEPRLLRLMADYLEAAA